MKIFAFLMTMLISVSAYGAIDYKAAQRGSSFFYPQSLTHIGPDSSIFAQTLGSSYGRTGDFMLSEPGANAGTKITLGQITAYRTANGDQSWVIFDRLVFVPTGTALFDNWTGILEYFGDSLNFNDISYPVIWGPGFRGASPTSSGQDVQWLQAFIIIPEPFTVIPMLAFAGFVATRRFR